MSVVITVGAGGIGRATMECFEADVAKLTACQDISAGSAAETAALAGNFAIATDVSQE
jgi:NAD(P)-dependent dehydrogenase (short-subunit alcohol dehydrogenase family)